MVNLQIKERTIVSVGHVIALAADPTSMYPW
jgi:hypothetical protein